MKYKITSGKLKGEIIELEEVKTTTHNNLKWSRTAPDEMTWHEAKEYASSLGEGWRLPTIQELTSVIDYAKYNPATDLDMKSDYYWSSTSLADNSAFAWFVDFLYGYVSNAYEDNSYHVRCVKSINN